MKHTHITLITILALGSLAASAAVPLLWTVETSRATPATFEAYQGETLALEAAMQSAGKPLELSGIASLYWQTNGMGSAYWETSAAVNSNRLSAVFTPEMDVGAKVYNCFIGVPGTIYHAAFQLRLRPSPGATPNVLPLPVPVIDFAKVRVLNPPWEGGGGGSGVDTNAVEIIANRAVETNAVTVGLSSSVSGLHSSKLDKTSVDPTLTTNGVPADAAAVGNLPYVKYNIDGAVLKLEPAHDELPNSIDFSNYNNVNLPLFSSYNGNIYGTLRIINMSENEDSIFIDSQDGYIILNNAGLTFNDQTTYSPSSIAYNGVGFSFPHRDGTLSLDDWISLSAMLDKSAASDLASHPAFSNAVMGVASHTNAAFAAEVLAVQVAGLSTNITAEVYIAATNACANLGIDPALIPQEGTLGTVGGLLVALAAAVALLRKKTKLLKSDGTAEDDFATELLGKPVAISAMKYGLASTSATVKAADRTVTKVTLGTTAVTVTFPDADENGKTRDFLLRIDAANLATGGSLTITKPTGAVIYGDAFPSPEATKQYLVAITETAVNEFYVRTIEITIPTEA